ncbi:MAG: hypothetical protein U0X93_01560 [Anaerolineales bacterium]
MEKFVIEGGVPLKGEVTPSGNKNAALPLLAACLLTDEPVVLKNIPQIQDVKVMRKLIESAGASVDELDATSWRVTSRTLGRVASTPIFVASSALRSSWRGSFPRGWASLTTHAGRRCDRAPPSRHAHPPLRAPRRGRAYDRGFKFQADGLRGANILMDEASVTATENAIMAAVTAKGDTVIQNAASSRTAGTVPVSESAWGAHRRDRLEHASYSWRAETSRRRIYDRTGLSRGH